MRTISQILFVLLFCYIQVSWAADAQQKEFGHFLLSKYKICGVEPPCKSYNGFCAHENVYSNGTGDTVFCCLKVKCYTQMENQKETGYNEVTTAFSPLIECFGQNFPVAISESLHNTIYKISQCKDKDTVLLMQDELFCLNLLYNLFRSNELLNLLKLS